MSSIQIYSKKKDKNDFDALSQRIIPNAEKRFCSGEVSKGFIEHCMETSDYLLCHFFQNTIRGFAYLSLHHNPKYLYIDLICNSKFHSMTRKSTVNSAKFGGKHLIDAIIQHGKRLKVKHVKLRAIPNVITYYYKLNFHFQNLSADKQLLDNLKNAQAIKDDKQTNMLVNKVVQKYYPGFYNEKNQRDFGSNKHEGAMDSGILMIYTYKPQSVCKGKSVKNPNHCRKYPDCKVAQGTKRAFCRLKKNKSLRNPN